MRDVRFIASATAFVAVGLVSQLAFAQKIRSYGTEAESQYGAQQQGSTAVNAASGQTGATQVTKVDTSAGAQAQGADGAPAGQEGGEKVEMTSYVTVFQPGGANAPLPVDLSPDKMYRGVIPGTRDEVSHLVKARDTAADRSKRNALTWIGFQAKEDSTRVFFQTGRESTYDLGSDGGAVTVTFNDTRLSASNFGRFIDTSFFNRNVTRIEVKQVNKTTVVAKISLRSFEQPDVDRSGNYVMLDFSGRAMNESGSKSTDSGTTDSGSDDSE